MDLSHPLRGTSTVQGGQLDPGGSLEEHGRGDSDDFEHFGQHSLDILLRGVLVCTFPWSHLRDQENPLEAVLRADHGPNPHIKRFDSLQILR